MPELNALKYGDQLLVHEPGGSTRSNATSTHLVSSQRAPMPGPRSTALLFAVFALLAVALNVPARAQDVSTTLDGYLTNLVPLGFSGNAIVVQRGKVLLEKGYGLADRENRIAVTPDTVMTVGSISKQFTAA